LPSTSYETLSVQYVGIDELIPHHLPPKKNASWILVGFKDDLFEVVSFSSTIYYAITIVRNKNNNLHWRNIVVYGSAYHEHKMEYIAELHVVKESPAFPTLVCGDFNLVRGPGKKK
jgi:hypothetical protein